MIQPSDEELLAAIATGPGALTEFYRRHAARVTGMGVRRFSNPEDVADFVATVFLEVLGSAGSFDADRGRAVAWLHGVGSNVASTMYQRRSRDVQAAQRISGRALLDSDDYARVEERIDAAARLRQTYLAMRDLPEQDRKLLELVAVDGLSTRDAASALLITPVAARVRLSRARSRLRSALHENDRPETRALHTVQEESA